MKALVHRDLLTKLIWLVQEPLINLVYELQTILKRSVLCKALIIQNRQQTAAGTVTSEGNVNIDFACDLFAQLNKTGVDDYGRGKWFGPKMWLSGVMSVSDRTEVLHRPGWMRPLTCSLSEEMLMSCPVCLSRFSSCDTTTWPSSVTWQSSSSISEPHSTALETGDAQVKVAPSIPVHTLSPQS